VVRTVYHKSQSNYKQRYMHPKEALVSNGITNREVSRVAALSQQNTSGGSSKDAAEADSLEFVYPFGATLNVNKPAVPILSTGYIAYPLNRPIGALFNHSKGPGRLLVLGSVHFFHDDYLDKEGNVHIMEFCLQWLTGVESVTLNHIDAADPDINDYQQLPDIGALNSTARSCLSLDDDLPRDFTKMFDNSLFKFDTGLIPESVGLYEKLNVKKSTLTLIQPQFETPQPDLHPALFPPILREQPAPELDLLDLDEEFASDRVRLAHVTNKCSDEDLDYFVCQGGELLGVDKDLPVQERGDPKAILHHMMEQLSNWKKLHF